MKRRLVLYSGGQERRNALIHQDLIGLARADVGVRMTYIPFCAENAGVFFHRFKRRYGAYGATDFDCLGPDDPALPRGRQLERRVLQSDVIYLAGGNTFYFLKHLKRSGLFGMLRKFAARGGVLAGLSAGALILTPHIGLAGYPPFDRDENDVRLRDLHALNLARFEFFPHYRNSARMRSALEAWSRRSRHPVYACRDGSGIVIEDDCFTAHGDVMLFHQGRTLRIH